jgi:hypothetical protein
VPMPPEPSVPLEPPESLLAQIDRHRMIADKLRIHASLEIYQEFVNSHNNLLQAMILVAHLHELTRQGERERKRERGRRGEGSQPSASALSAPTTNSQPPTTNSTQYPRSTTATPAH